MIEPRNTPEIKTILIESTKGVVLFIASWTGVLLLGMAFQFLFSSNNTEEDVLKYVQIQLNWPFILMSDFEIHDMVSTVQRIMIALAAVAILPVGLLLYVRFGYKRSALAVYTLGTMVSQFIGFIVWVFRNG